MKAIFLSVSVVVGCRQSIKIDHSSFDTTCSVDEDCALYGFDDVCGGCQTVPLRRSAEATAANDNARLQCVEIADCLQGSEAACDAGLCVAVPLGTSE